MCHISSGDQVEDPRDRVVSIAKCIIGGRRRTFLLK